MVDINQSRLFNTNKNRAINEKIQKYYEGQENKPKQEEKVNDTPIVAVTAPNKKVKSNIKRKKGAPFKHKDPVFQTSKSFKVSFLLDTLLRVMTEKYATGKTKDEILREAMFEYIANRHPLEDKEDMLRDIEREVEIYRQNHAMIIEYDMDGNPIKTKEDLENDFVDYVTNSLKIRNKKK